MSLYVFIFFLLQHAMEILEDIILNMGIRGLVIGKDKFDSQEVINVGRCRSEELISPFVLILILIPFSLPINLAANNKF